MELREVCEVQLGFSARERLKPVSSGMHAIQQGDITAEGTFDGFDALRVHFDTGSDRHLVRPGDVLLRSRGTAVAAWAVSEDLHEAAIAMSPLYILRPAPDRLNSGYLAWMLMRPAAQAHFARESVGTNLKMIRRAAIESIPVELPALHVQRAVAATTELAKRERFLETQLAQLRNNLTALRLDACANPIHDDRTAE
jgi:hypothetical protein